MHHSSYLNAIVGAAGAKAAASRANHTDKRHGILWRSFGVSCRSAMVSAALPSECRPVLGLYRPRYSAFSCVRAHWMLFKWMLLWVWKASALGIAFTHSLSAPNGIPYFPVQLLEAACEAIIFLFVLRLSLRAAGQGRALWLYLCLYAPARFLLEFLRADTIRGIWFGLSTSQWVSVVLLAVCRKKDVFPGQTHQSKSKIKHTFPGRPKGI